MENDKITNVFIVMAHHLIILLDHRRLKLFIGKVADQVIEAQLNQIDTGRFKRFNKATGQANADTIFDPGITGHANPHLEMPGVNLLWFWA